MKCDALRSIVCGVTSTLMLMSLTTWTAAQSEKLNDVDLCNGRDRTSPESQITGCTAIIESDADNPKVLAIAHNNRGNAFIRKRQYEQAIKDYDESIKLNPNYAKPLNNRGVAYQKEGKYDRAIEDFDAAIKIDPNYLDAFANRAETYQKKGDYPRALRDFDQAIRLKPTLAVLLNERCWTRAIVGDLQEALADCNEALRLEPNVATTLDSRGLAHLKLGQWDSAIAEFYVGAAVGRKIGECPVRAGVSQAEAGRFRRRQRRYYGGEGS